MTGSLALLLAAGCSDYGGGALSASAPPPPPLLRAPVAAAASAAVLPFVGAVPPPPGTQAIFDPAGLRLVLDDPRLAAANAAEGKGDFATAAHQVEAALATQPPPSPADTLAWRYQLGRLRSLAGDPLGAARAFDEAAAADWPLAAHARFQAATLLARADQYDDALSRARAVPSGLGIAGDLELVVADALAGKGDIDGAAGMWRAYLRRKDHPPDWLNVTLRFARALLSRPSEAHAEEAVALARRVIFESTGGAGVGEARQIESEALSALPFTRRSQLEAPTSAELLVRADELLDADQLREAVRLTDALVALPEADRPGPLACSAWLVRGEALGKLKKKPESAEAYGKAIERCEGQPDKVKALFAGGRASLRAGSPPQAALRYAALEREFPSHSYADDARLQGARAALAMGDKARFVQMLSRMPDDYPAGDMVADGLFELALSSLEERDWAGAIVPLERALRASPRERAYASAGRLPYYLGRAYLATGAVDRGMDLLKSVVSDYPLSFYMALAYARVAERDPALAARTLDEAAAREPAGEPGAVASEAFAQPAFVRAALLAQQGDVKLAKAELDTLGLGARTAPPELLWAAAVLFARAGEVAQSHRILRAGQSQPAPDARAEVVDWGAHYPAGRFRAAWEMAYPRPYASLVAGEAARQNIPEALAFAIMREESAFDPRVVSAASAVGLMQLIVPTARKMGKSLGLPGDAQSLKRPEVNVPIGCHYLSVLRGQFEDNPLLAIPSYNAGAGAPKRWVASRPSDDFDLWVERIPYEETRLYTKRVIGSMAAYEFLYARDRASEAMRAPLAVSPAGRSAGPLLADQDQGG